MVAQHFNFAQYYIIVMICVIYLSNISGYIIGFLMRQDLAMLISKRSSSYNAAALSCCCYYEIILRLPLAYGGLSCNTSGSFAFSHWDAQVTI